MSRIKSGLDLHVPQSGAAVDAYEVACTALILARRQGDVPPPYGPARHAVALHRISGQLHRIAERQCNEDLTCPDCGGDGRAVGDTGENVDCRACVGTGNTLGRREARLERQAREIADHYGLLCYFQGDPRGCSLYLIDPADVPAVAELAKRDVSGAVSPKAAEYLRSREAWIEANYNRGHAVVRIGR